MLEKIKEELISLATESQKKFNEKLVPNALPILGVKIPEIRKLTKKICKEDYIQFLREYDASSFELQMLYALVIATAKMPIKTRLEYLKIFLPTIQDWAICDSLVSSLKCTKVNLDIVLSFLKEYQESQNEFEIRFVAVMLMQYFLEDAYVEQALQMIKKLYLKSYYAKMGVAWFIATLMNRYEKQAFELLTYFDDIEIKSFTIRKIRDSYRITDEVKEKVLQFKK